MRVWRAPDRRGKGRRLGDLTPGHTGTTDQSPKALIDRVRRNCELRRHSWHERLTRTLSLPSPAGGVREGFGGAERAPNVPVLRAFRWELV
jgi:hypothetical protein